MAKQVVVHHLFRDRHPYPVDESKILYNRLRMALLHLSLERVARVIDLHKDMPGFGQCMTWLLESDVMSRRQSLEQMRQRDDDWFLTKFDCRI